MLGLALALLPRAGSAGQAVIDASAPGPPAPEEAGAEDYEWLFDQPDPAARDPIEPINRGIFTLNDGLYRWLLTPVSQGYAFAVPGPARRAVGRFFANLREPVTVVNDLLQLHPVRAGLSLSRFMVNTTIGMAGLLDPAGRWGLVCGRNDFGMTLAVYRVSSGPYLVLPILGPSTMRDAVGQLVDSVFRLDQLIFGPTARLVLWTADGVSTYDIERERLAALRRTSVDFYAAVRGAYLLDRTAQVNLSIDEAPWRRESRSGPTL